MVQETNTNTTTVTDYLNGFQYKNNVLQYFPTTEGYVNFVLDPVFADKGKYSYVYNYTDHLGNIRLSYAINPVNNQLTVVEENHYYPFGLKHRGYNQDKKIFEVDLGKLNLKPAPPYFRNGNNYKYNGKELQEELGLNVYDYGARNYMPDIGRWGNVDPLAENYYPISTYGYALNNPNYFVDPNGKEIWIYSDYGDEKNGKREKYEYVKDRDYSKYTGFRADAFKALDAIYKVGNIDINGESVNIMDRLMNDKRELSVVKSCEDCGSAFSETRKFTDINNTSSESRNNIGTIFFDNKNGVLFDDVKDSNKSTLDKQLASNKFSNTSKINSPTSLLGHEMGHAFGYLENSVAYWGRKYDYSGHSNVPYFDDKEEARATSLSTQINIRLSENPRLNHRGTKIKTDGVMSNKKL